MTRRAILLIGTEKTGTTTLQQFFALNRDRLAERGFHYPAFCGDRNHTGLAAYALDPARMDEIRTPFGGRTPDDVPAMRARIEAAAREELSGLSGTVIFCNEHCHSRLTSAAEVATLHRLLAPHFDDIRIAVYLRRQDQVALSLYSTLLKSGGQQVNLLPGSGPGDPYYNYDKSLSLWAEVFGPDAVVPRLFDRKVLAGGSVVDDFCLAWGLGDPGSYRPTDDFNGSITGAAQEFLRHANRYLTVQAGADPRVRGMLVSRLEQLFPGKGPRPARAQAWAFYAQYRPSNDMVRRRYFPDRETLFDETFDSYPEDPDPREITVDDAARIAMRLHEAAMADVVRLESEIALRDARLAWQGQKPAEAIAAMRRAVRLRPDHAEMQRTLAEYLLQSGQVSEAVSVARAAVELRPANAEFRHFLGIALRRSGDPEAAARAQSDALALQPDYPGALRELSLVAPAGPAAAAPPG